MSFNRDLKKVIGEELAPLAESMFRIKQEAASRADDSGWSRHRFPKKSREILFGTDPVKSEESRYEFAMFQHKLTLGEITSPIVREYYERARSRMMPTQKAWEELASIAREKEIREAKVARLEQEIYQTENEKFALQSRSVRRSSEDRLKFAKDLWRSLFLDFEHDKKLSSPRIFVVSTPLAAPWTLAAALDIKPLTASATPRLDAFLVLTHEANKGFRRSDLFYPFFSGLLLPCYRSPWEAPSPAHIETHLRYEALCARETIAALVDPVRRAIMKHVAKSNS